MCVSIFEFCLVQRDANLLSVLTHKHRVSKIGLQLFFVSDEPPVDTRALNKTNIIYY